VAQRDPDAKARLIDAAADLFGQHGFRDTSIDAIATEAGVSRSLVFWHFDSKERLLWTVAAESMRRWIASMAEATERLRGLAALRYHIERRKTIIAEDVAELRLVHLVVGEAIASGDNGDEALADLRSCLHDAQGLFRRWIAEAIEDGEIAPVASPDALADLVYSSLNGIDWLRFVHGPSFDTDSADTALLGLVLSAR
jgi:TetR/AcrR family transcriptional regulator